MSIAIWVGLLAAAVTLLTLLLTRMLPLVRLGGPGVFAGFAAGALITAALVHLLPEAYASRADAPRWALLGFALGFLFNRGVLAMGGHTHEADGKRFTAMLAVAGIAFHSLVDGLAHAITFAYEFQTGLLTAIGLILHEAPEALVVLVLLTQAGFAAGRAVVITFVAAGLTTPLGALLGTWMLGLHIDDGALAALLAIAAGLLLFVGAGHLLPHVEKEPAGRSLPALLAGGLLVLAGRLLPLEPPGHEHLHEGIAPAATLHLAH